MCERNFLPVISGAVLNLDPHATMLTSGWHDAVIQYAAPLYHRCKVI